MSVKPPAQKYAEHGRTMTSTYTLVLWPVTLSVSHAVSPAQSTKAFSPGACLKRRAAPDSLASCANISQNAW